MLTPVPVGTDPVALIGLADTAADAWRTVAPHLATHPAARVLVIGGLPAVIGLHAVGLAVALGAASVDYHDPDPTRCGIAAAYGGHITDSPDKAPADGYDIVVVANPSQNALELAVRTAAAGGVITNTTPTFGDRGASQAFDTADLYHRGITWVIGRPDCRHTHEGVVTAWVTAGFRPNTVPTTVVEWDDAPQAWSNNAVHIAAVRT
jgi:alcohol dehydrogenase